MKNKKIILLFFLFLWMATIFIFSHQSAEKSQNLSDTFTIKLIEKITGKKLQEKEKIAYTKKMRFLIRKSAHFLVYFVLGILFFSLLNAYQKKHIILESTLLSFLYACSDEFHQLFISNRTGRLLDIMIDTIGAFLGIGLFFLIYHFIEKKKRFLQENIK